MELLNLPVKPSSITLVLPSSICSSKKSNMLDLNSPSDVTCLKLGMCSNPKCKLSSDFEPTVSLSSPIAQLNPAPCQWIIDLFTKRFGDGHFPPFDMNNDTFSDVCTLRSYHWKDADCDELNKNIYPGRKEGKNKIIGHDCNGMYGNSNSTGKSFESLLCDNTNRLGVAVIGDSAEAHFSIPKKYFNATFIHKGTYHDILKRVADELDIPHESGYTAHVPTTDYVSHSVYRYLRNSSLCNNNDYQNLGINVGDSGNTWVTSKLLNEIPPMTIRC
jgi:hypothetical protein